MSFATDVTAMDAAIAAIADVPTALVALQKTEVVLDQIVLMADVATNIRPVSPKENGDELVANSPSSDGGLEMSVPGRSNGINGLPLNFTQATALVAGQSGVAYTETLETSGGNAGDNLTFTLDPRTTLPTGLSLNASTGVVSGTPSVNGSFSFIIRVADESGNAVSKLFTLVLAAP